MFILPFITASNHMYISRLHFVCEEETSTFYCTVNSVITICLQIKQNMSLIIFSDYLLDAWKEKRLPFYTKLCNSTPLLALLQMCCMNRQECDNKKQTALFPQMAIHRSQHNIKSLQNITLTFVIHFYDTITKLVVRYTVWCSSQVSIPTKQQRLHKWNCFLKP